MVRYRLVEMKRTLEPELMDDEQQSAAYAEADFSTSNQFFVDSLVRDFPTSPARRRRYRMRPR